MYDLGNLQLEPHPPPTCPTRPGCLKLKVTHCAERVLANTGSHQLCWGDWKGWVLLPHVEVVRLLG